MAMLCNGNKKLKNKIYNVLLLAKPLGFYQPDKGKESWMTLLECDLFFNKNVSKAYTYSLSIKMTKLNTIF